MQKSSFLPDHLNYNKLKGYYGISVHEHIRGLIDVISAFVFDFLNRDIVLCLCEVSQFLCFIF